MKKFIAAFAFWLLAVSGFADDTCIPASPVPFRLVNNFSKAFPDFLSSAEKQALEDKLQQFHKETSNQIVIIVVDDLCGYDANEFSTRIGQTWGVGQGKFDNGVVVMIKPTGGAGQREAYIAVGYGLEGVIPDITANRILDNEIFPRFKNGDFYNALDVSTDILISLAKKDFSYKDYQKKGTKNWMPFLSFIVLFVIYIFFSFRRRSYTMTRRGRTFYGGGWGWGGGFGGFGGGSSGGGFGGGSFGGGSFGGGGAGGRW